MTRGETAAKDIVKEIGAITSLLVEVGVCDDQNVASMATSRDGVVSVHYANSAPIAAMLKDQPYRDTYYGQLSARSYNLRLLDGALVQMSYTIGRDGELASHRLVFLPSPDLSEFQNDPELYLEDDARYAEVVERRTVSVPLRFDYDPRPEVTHDLLHPVSHLTLGQYSRCRIPATGGITPAAFITFLLRSFYSTAALDLGDRVRLMVPLYRSTITSNELATIHIGVPVRP